MNWIEANLVQVMYWLDLLGQLLPAVLTIAVIFTFFLVQGYSRKLSRMEFYLDRIDNHLREITYFIKEYQVEKGGDGGEDESDGGQRKSGIPASGGRTQR